ncbi:MAG: GH3 auxin-responsive promoter family protein [Cytophagales bacterium]|nr:GH3 auxin-responsive promoter family protein [Cytophagales bacterium]
MAILGSLLKKGIMLRESIAQQYTSPIDLQKQELRELIIHTQNTAFAKAHGFNELLKAFRKNNNETFYEAFKSNVPIFDYDKMYREWWHLAQQGQSNVSWPGKIKYFALSSGTSGTASKHIPISMDMVKSIRKTSIRQILSLSKYDLPDKFFSKGILAVGGSTDLRRNGHYFEGDLSGITAAQIPFWFQHFYKPGKKISKSNNWQAKLEEMTRQAKDWDIGIIVGVPAWIQMLLEKIIAYYRVDNIHDVWPNLSIFVHGGVSFEPYRKGFQKLLGRPLHCLETYLASEGFIAFQAFPDRKSMRLVLNNGIFYEFIPFNKRNFSDDGELLNNPEVLKIDQVEENREYALLISTNAGTFRYFIGDVIKFVSIEESEIVITGRTKHFLSLCGEHLSVDNMNKAIEIASDEFNIDIREFTVIGEPCGSLFAHRWFIGTDDDINEEALRVKIDQTLRELNDDYGVERDNALKNIYLHVMPAGQFINWMKKQGKVGAQNKFPRVLKGEKADEWKVYVEENTLVS